MTDSGRRRKCHVLVEKKMLIDGTYEEEGTWVPVANAWVRIDPERGSERFAGDEEQLITTHMIRFDFMDAIDLDEGMRVVFHRKTQFYGDTNFDVPPDATVFRIIAPLADENDKDDIVMRCREEGRPYGELSKGR